MAVFKYEGMSAAGTQVSGVVEAFDEMDALEKARMQCRVVDKISPVRETPGFLKMEVGSGKVKPKELSIMCNQFATIIKAGMSTAACVSMVAEQTTDKKLKPILLAVQQDVSAGHSLADSFESKGGDKLPVILYETIRAGELAGTLDQSFVTLHKYFDTSYKNKAKVSQALIYPTFVIILAIVVVAVMMVAVVPTFKEILESNDQEMPAMTQVLIDASDFFSAHGIVILLVVALVIIGIKVWTKTPKGMEQWGRLKLKMPVVGKIAVFSNAAMYANTMSVLLGSGLQVTSAVATTAKVLDNYVISTGVSKMVSKLEEGRRLGDCMRDVEGLPMPLVEMAAVGEETGELEATLATMGEFYDEETNRATQAALSKLEPATLIFIGAFAGYIVAALYIAMFSMYNGM